MNAKDKAQLKRIQKHIAPYRVTRGKDFRLKDIDPRDTGGLKSEDKGEAKEMLQRGVEWLAKEQDMLYAQDHWALLLVFQAMDAAGKDGTIKHLTSGINTQGCHVTSYKQPSSEELDHDFLWRYMRNVPARGMIGIFNRSYYEELLVVKVHPELLARQKLHPSLIKKSVWDDRYEDISNYERYLHRNGVRVVKFFLHVSHAEQKRRFMERLDQPEKNWKFSASDVAERKHWSDYQEAYEEAIKNTASKYAPWYVVPADNKWFTRLTVAAAVVEAMADLNLEYPEVSADKRKALAAAQARTRERVSGAAQRNIPDVTGTQRGAREGARLARRLPQGVAAAGHHCRPDYCGGRHSESHGLRHGGGPSGPGRVVHGVRAGRDLRVARELARAQRQHHDDDRDPHGRQPRSRRPRRRSGRAADARPPRWRRWSASCSCSPPSCASDSSPRSSRSRCCPASRPASAS